MPKFIFAYHGGGMMPQDPKEIQKIMAAWGAWFESMGESVVDGGHPLGISKTVTSAGVDDNGGANPLSGYSLVNAGDIDEAVAMAKGCPNLENGGSVEVAEAMEM